MNYKLFDLAARYFMNSSQLLIFLNKQHTRIPVFMV